MSATFTWTVIGMSCYPQADNQTDVVFNVNWFCQAVEGAYQASTLGEANVTYTAGSPFTPYAEITEVQALGWVFGSINQFDVESSLQKQIDNQINPPVIQPPLPWATA